MDVNEKIRILVSNSNRDCIKMMELKIGLKFIVSEFCIGINLAFETPIVCTVRVNKSTLFLTRINRGDTRIRGIR